MRKKLTAGLADLVKKPFNSMNKYLETMPYRGSGRFCPLCGKSSSRFREFGIVPRKDAQCTRCGALERHRLLWLYLAKKTDLFDGRAITMLHVAPEACFEPRLRKPLGKNYITADLFDPSAMVKMDVTDIGYPDQSFDVIYCSHVLEHVQDDRRAMREFHRVLKETGWAILLVPITVEATFEDPSIIEPSERLKAFGQGDHVRRYGTDYTERLREAGFKVTVVTIEQFVDAEDAIRMGLTAASGEIYHCTR
jgi:SAM-dependent methyltransferase